SPASRSKMLDPGFGPDRAFAPTQLQADEVLQQEPALIVERPIERTPQDRIPNTDVEQQDLRVSDQRCPVGAAPCGNAKGDQRVLQNVDVAARRLITDACIPRKGVKID